MKNNVIVRMILNHIFFFMCDPLYMIFGWNVLDLDYMWDLFYWTFDWHRTVALKVSRRMVEISLLKNWTRFPTPRLLLGEVVEVLVTDVNNLRNMDINVSLIIDCSFSSTHFVFLLLTLITLTSLIFSSFGLYIVVCVFSSFKYRLLLWVWML